MATRKTSKVKPRGSRVTKLPRGTSLPRGSIKSLSVAGGSTLNLAQVNDNFSIWLDVFATFAFPDGKTPSLSNRR